MQNPEDLLKDPGIKNRKHKRNYARSLKRVRDYSGNLFVRIRLKPKGAII